MPRLIDADALLEKVQFRLPIDNYNAEVISGCVGISRRLIETAPTIDAVPAVRCKDCKYRFKNNGHDRKGCPIVDAEIWMDDNDFCSYGERRSDDL